MVHDAGQTGSIGLHILGQHPGGILVDILVCTGDDLEDLRQGVLEGVVLHLLLIAAPEAGDQLLQLPVLLRVAGLSGRQSAAEVLAHHGHGAAEQVAQIVGQVHVDGVDEGLVGEIAVRAEGEGTQQEEAQGVHAEVLRQQIGVHHVALGLGHLATVQQQPAVAEHLLGQGHLHAHQHGGPDDGVEPDDLLAHDVDAGPPALVVVVVAVVVIAQGGDIVAEGVHPHIDYVLGIEVHRNAPGEAGAGDAQILQAGVQEVLHHLVDAATGLEEVGVLQQIPDLVGVLAQAEKVGLLLRVLHLPAAVGALAVHQLALGPEGLAGGAVFALVGALVDVALVVHLLENLLDALHMVVVGGADEPVVGDVHQLPQVEHAPGALHDVVDKLLGGYAGLLGLVLDLLAVLVGAGEEHDLTAPQALIAGHGVGGHGAVGVADVQLIAGVVDGGGDIKSLLFHGSDSSR